MRRDTVKLGNASARLWLGKDNRWKWHSYEAGRRVLKSSKDLHKARQKAKEGLAAMRDGKAVMADLSPAMLSEFLAWRSARIESPTVAEGAAKYLAHLTARKVQETRIVKSDLEKFAAAHPCKMSEVTVEQVGNYLAGLGVGPRRFNNVRSALVSFFRWARTTGLVPDTMTAPERTHLMPLPKDTVAVYTPKQFRALLAVAPKEWQLGFAIGGLAGLRTEEIAGLRWEDIKLGRKLIEVRAEICKTGKRRLVPIVPSLAKIIRTSEPCAHNMVVPRERIDNAVKRVRKAGGFWVKNGLRHSFGSYRCAAVKSVGQVALEMGNSEAMVRKHYLEMQTLKAARDWFNTGSILPKNPD
jgi:integrase